MVSKHTALMSNRSYLLRYWRLVAGPAHLPLFTQYNCLAADSLVAKVWWALISSDGRAFNTLNSEPTTLNCTPALRVCSNCIPNLAHSMPGKHTWLQDKSFEELVGWSMCYSELIIQSLGRFPDL